MFQFRFDAAKVSKRPIRAKEKEKNLSKKSRTKE
jgi:hypothetical protein